MKTFRRALVLLVIIALAGAWLWWANRPQPIEVSVATVERGVVERTVANTRAGTVKACRRAGLSPSTGGQIARLPVKEGDRVKQGQLLLELWNEDLKANLELARQQAEAGQATAKARCIEAAQAERESRRLHKLLDRKLIAEDKADQADARARSARAACTAASAEAAVARARMGVAEAQLSKTRLTAPFAGVVAQINGELAEYVTPSPVGIATPPAIDLIDNGCFYLSAPIDEVDVAGVKVGQVARITLDAFGERRFSGKVRRVADYVLDREKQARTVEVEVSFSDPHDRPDLLAGYSADVEIILDTRQNTLRIPSEALIEGQRVYVLRTDGIVEQREVKAGVANWDYTEILDGLSEGEQVITSVDREGLAEGVMAVAKGTSGK
ncbi:MAG: efflux RND transporter periplasmic adaptor subunit [Gammaproteobacteria bacterium]|nr:MAG: efflux RND transporter periplasmic adaptor subunit [Gammaproteobacteria bacterium]